MILIPEIEKVAILVPRTGTSSLRRAVAKAYPRSIQLYRHMEADGVPYGYNRWEKIGVIRHPVERLWSLYKLLREFDGDYDPAYIEKMRTSVEITFSEWIMRNDQVFTSPYDSTPQGRFWPRYSVLHPLPENRKSQFVYLRPDLGTTIYQYSRLAELEAKLGIVLERHNSTAPSEMPALSVEVDRYLQRMFLWDFNRAH